MQRTRQTLVRTCPTIARPILAAVLLFCVLSGALPSEAALHPEGLMACCRGMKGTAGECHGDSCPLHLGARKKPARQVESDPVCGAADALRAVAGTPAPAPRNYFGQAHSQRQAQAEVEHDHGGSVSPRNTPQTPQWSASLGKRCPSDCCGVTSSFAGLRRPKQAAVLTGDVRPRPPTVEAHRHAPSGRLKFASALRRSHPPRAPPTVTDSRTA